MPRVNPITNPTTRVSVTLDVKTKQTLEEIEYQEYVQNRVMRAYHEMLENGSQGVSSREAKEIVLQRISQRLNNQ